jgi:hypothetical protein
VTLRFLPWLRRGLAAAIPPTPPSGPATDGRPAVAVTLAVRHDDTVEPVVATLRLYGPGDVLQLDPAQVIAADPKPNATASEPNLLASVCFDAPELPWLFSPGSTPAVADPAGRLKPWLCLVVVRRDAAELVPDPRRPVPTLRIADATGELPDLADAWAWAHAQLAGDGSVGDVLTGPAERTLSRLVCPRRLRPDTAYLACVVPAYAAGRQAGLGEPVTAGTEPAWTFPPTGPIELPVYYSWSFSTGPAGDFEALVRRLVPRAVGETVGLRPMDVSHAGPGLPVLDPEQPGAVLGSEGALRSPAMLSSPWPDPARADFQRRLLVQLDAPQGGAVTVLTPPLYGGAATGAASLADAASPPAWLRELNLDPRYRAAAGIGVRVVQDQQEQLVAAAWDQLGEVAAATRLLREAQLARAVAGSLWAKRLAHLPAAVRLRVAEPALARIPAPQAPPAKHPPGQGSPATGPGSPAGPGSLLGMVRASALPESAVSGAMRRVLRPRGPLGRRVGGEAPVSRLLHGLATGGVPMPVTAVPDGTVLHDAVGAPKLGQVTAGVPAAPGWRLVAEYLQYSDRTATDAAAPAGAQPAGPAPGRGAVPQVRHASLRRIDDDLPPDQGEQVPARRRRLGGINGRFRTAARSLQAYLAQPVTLAPAAEVAELPVDAVAAYLCAPGGRVDPEVGVPAAILPRIEPTPPVPAGRDRLAPTVASPRFPQPMSRALSTDLLLPGSDQIPADTVGLLAGNPRFVEAFLVGLNHELGREFLWRGVPVDPRATYFQQFWDLRGADPAGSAADIPPIADWAPGSRLGENASRARGRDVLALLIRGELVRRYPTVTVYAVRATTSGTLGGPEQYPQFRYLLDAQTLLAGFALDLTEARGTPGWFFVLQEQITEPRFGLDEPDGTFGGTPASWRDLTWGHLVANEAAYAGLGHVPVRPPLLNPGLQNLTHDGATYGRGAADMAQILLQQPVRVAVHARALLPDPTLPPTRIADAHPLLIQSEPA